MSVFFKEPKPLPVIRWLAGNLQIGNYIIPWQQCTVNLDASFQFDDGEIVTHGVLLKFTHPNLVPEIFPNPKQPEEWAWFLEGELAEAVRQFLTSDHK